LNGEANGYAEVMYSDGALFRGVFAGNAVSGFGDYESAFAERTKGTFKDGCLHIPLIAVFL